MAIPSVAGPIEGGAHGWPFGRPLLDLDKLGYLEEEWILGGRATSYALDGEMTRDGRWLASPREQAPYRTRAVVHRPRDPGRSSGIAIIYWNNVSAGYDLFGESAEIFDAGHALVAVTAQKVGIEGLPSMRMGLRDWDAPRYGTLRHPGDDWSYDIFSQVANAARDDRLGGLGASRLVAMGASQSAARLASYANAIHPLTRCFDAYLLQIWFGRGTGFQIGDAILDLSTATPSSQTDYMRGRHQVRGDLDVPVMVVNSELESVPCFHVRQPDTDRFRYWEVAATSHVSSQVQALRALRFERDFGRPPPVAATTNRVPLTPVYDAALRHLVRWMDGGAPPPVQPRIEFAGDPPTVVRDEHGLARGGIRLPQADVPIAVNSSIPTGTSVLTLLNGSWEPFPADEVRALYGDREVYLALFEASARAAVDEGVLLARDIEALVAEAATSWPDG